MANGINDTSGYTEAFYNAFQTGYQLVLQEEQDVYAGKVSVDTLEGEYKSYDFIGTIDLDDKETRFEDIPIEDMEHTKRWMYPKWSRKGIFMDSEDEVALHTDPTGSYIQSLAKGVMRKKNDRIHAAWFASVTGGKNPGDSTHSFVDTAFTTTAGTGGRTIVHDARKDYSTGGVSTGLSVEKLILAREALLQLKNNPNQKMYIGVNPRNISDLVREAVTQSIDTSEVRSLAAGTISKYSGFEFVIDYNITIGSSNDIDADTNVYECPVWVKEAMLYAQHQGPIIKVDWIPRKQIWQLSARVGQNAIRMDEDKVLKIECAAVA